MPLYLCTPATGGKLVQDRRNVASESDLSVDNLGQFLFIVMMFLGLLIIFLG